MQRTDWTVRIVFTKEYGAHIDIDYRGSIADVREYVERCATVGLFWTHGEDGKEPTSCKFFPSHTILRIDVDAKRPTVVRDVTENKTEAQKTAPPKPAAAATKTPPVKAPAKKVAGKR